MIYLMILLILDVYNVNIGEYNGVCRNFIAIMAK